MDKPGFDIGFLMDRVVTRTKSFLSDELETNVLSSRFQLQNVTKIDLRELSSIVVVGGPVNMIVAFSFDHGLIERLFKIYTDDIDVEEGERDLFHGETAGDIINTVIGNVTADIKKNGGALTFSPPVILSGARSLLRHRDAKFYAASMDTEYGALAVNVIGPPELFDQYLNYKE